MFVCAYRYRKKWKKQLVTISLLDNSVIISWSNRIPSNWSSKKGELLTAHRFCHSPPLTSHHLLDERNPAPVDMANVPSCLISQLVQEFFHQPSNGKNLSSKLHCRCHISWLGNDGVGYGVHFLLNGRVFGHNTLHIFCAKNFIKPGYGRIIGQSWRLVVRSFLIRRCFPQLWLSVLSEPWGECKHRLETCSRISHAKFLPPLPPKWFPEIWVNAKALLNLLNFFLVEVALSQVGFQYLEFLRLSFGKITKKNRAKQQPKKIKNNTPGDTWKIRRFLCFNETFQL